MDDIEKWLALDDEVNVIWEWYSFIKLTLQYLKVLKWKEDVGGLYTINCRYQSKVLEMFRYIHIKVTDSKKKGLSGWV